MKALVVSLHDVSPQTRSRCQRIVEELTALGVNKLSLLVIPNHHDKGHVQADDALCAWLRTAAAEGHEIVTHGYYHRRPRRTGETLTQKLTTRIYTADEGEFYDIDGSSAATLVRRANAELRDLGLAPRGFIAPAWLLSDEAETALRELGCDYTTRLKTVTDLQSGRQHESQSLCWSVRAAWRRSVSLLWNAHLYRRLQNTTLMRVAVHPPDIDHPGIWRQILALVSDALRTRIPMTYLEWINVSRGETSIAGTR